MRSACSWSGHRVKSSSAQLVTFGPAQRIVCNPWSSKNLAQSPRRFASALITRTERGAIRVSEKKRRVSGGSAITVFLWARGFTFDLLLRGQIGVVHAPLTGPSGPSRGGPKARPEQTG